ncbi:MAG: hypothetical protein ACK4VW_03210 [Anaerolineales bacterium]
MAFQVSDYRDLIVLLHQHPEWRDELRYLLLTREILELPKSVAELVEAQKRSEERLTRLEQAVAELVEAQKRNEERLAGVEERLARAEERLAGVEERLTHAEDRLTRLEQAVVELVEAQKRNEERLARAEERLADVEERLARVEKQVQKLTVRVDTLTDHVNEMRGTLLEMHYQKHAFGFFGKLIRRAQVVDLQEIWAEKIEPHLDETERENLLFLDLLIRGQARPSLAEQLGSAELWLAVEVSTTVDRRDVERARQRADLLTKAGLMAVAVAAGQKITQGANALAKELGVILQKDGLLLHVENALARCKKGEVPSRATGAGEV